MILSAGCSSVISMRDALRESVEQAAAMTQLATLGDLEPHAAESGSTDVASYDTKGTDTPPTAADLAESLADDPAAVAAAIETAISELTEADSLDTASKAALIETLQLTPQADWPVVIEEFTATLAALRAADAADDQEVAAPTTNTTAPEPAASDEPEVLSLDEAVAAAAGDTAAATPAVSVTSSEERPAEAAVTTPPAMTAPAQLPAEPTAVAFADAATDTAVPAITPAGPPPASSLSIEHPCLAQQVRGWGQVDRFDPADLHPGSEVIAYFELSGITSTPTPAGVTTSIDTTMRLEDARGNRLHDWSFPPVTETCAAQRRDYFALYLLELPADLPAGEHRLVLSVTDLQAGSTAEASIALLVTTK